MTELDPLWLDWSRRRPDAQVVHLDSAAAGRSSLAVLQAATDYARREAEVGAYVAEAEAAELLAAGRADLAAVLGVRTDGLAFVESASAALCALLAAWPLGEGARVAVTDTEWGPNLQLFARHRLRTIRLATDAHGLLDLSALAALLDSSPPDLVNLTYVAAHRAAVQPVAEAAALCRAAGVPLWVDAAQAIGHVDTAVNADALYATSRKWLAGPRGVGFLAIAARRWADLVGDKPVLSPAQLPRAQWLESREANVAGRVGLCVAAREFLATGPKEVIARLGEVGAMTRAVLADVPGWRVVDPPDALGAITALVPTHGQDVAAERARLLGEHAILVSASQVVRAPNDLSEPLLRVSPHVDCTEDSLSKLATALRV